MPTKGVSMSDEVQQSIGFNELGLSEPIMDALNDVGYETPSPIQAEIIPHVRDGYDVLGQAQTGTGKTAAFALPLLSTIDLKQKLPQIMVLAPTRELAIQVAEAFQKYAKYLKGFQVLPIYGGQSYTEQIRRLKKGVHVVVGTPGRVMDHMRKETLKLDGLKCLVLDEADEMLRMGFIDDVEWILEQIPEVHQTALFSATMPREIHKIAQKYLDDPKEVKIQVKETTAETINQRYLMVSFPQKMEALTRILEVEDVDAAIIFVRTKTMTTEVADKLKARGYLAAPLNGDIAQSHREKTINDLKKGKLNIVVATDVAARGLDVERITHVFNFDIPYDTESYVHRIGRTGRAGRNGEAILFVGGRERHLLKSIERATKKKIELYQMPSTDEINNQRIEQFKQKISDKIENQNLSFFTNLILKYQEENEHYSLESIAAALADLYQGGTPLLLKKMPEMPKANDGRREKKDRDKGPRISNDELTSFRIEVGHKHDINPGNIVGVIANVGGIGSKNIGRIKIFDDFSTVDLPSDIPENTLKAIGNVKLSNTMLRITPTGEAVDGSSRGGGGGFRGKKKRDHRGQGGNRRRRR